jgi:hypothetical protein
LTQSFPSNIRKTLSRKNAFYFFTSVGNYTGHRAITLEEFADIIREVETASLEFHLYRGDFEKWTNEILEDPELTKRIGAVKLLEPIGNVLRDQLDFTVTNRLEELKNLQKV